MDCGNCTACCTLLPIAEIGKPINTPCQHCDKGCTIYQGKPKTCTEFECAYIQGKQLPEKLRPDKCGIIFYKRTDHIFTGAIIGGAEVTDAAKQQIASFNEQGYSVVLLSVEEKAPLLCLANGHRAAEVQRDYLEAVSGNV